MTRNDQLNEAIARMKKLKLHPNTIADLKNGTVNVSYHMGALYWADDDQKKIIADFENKTGALVYHCISTNTEFGLLFNMLFVSKHEDEWEIDNEDIENLFPIAMVENLSDSLCSDMGCIGVKPIFGGLVRIF